MTGGPRLREGRDEDGPGLALLISGVFAEYPDIVFLDKEFPELAAPATHFRDRGGKLWVLDESGTIVGSIAVAPSGETGVNELFKFYLVRDKRGSGLAGVLLGQALQFAERRGSRAMLLWSDTRFLSGHRFYEKNGFVRAPGERALHDASNSREYLFRRDLTP